MIRHHRWMVLWLFAASSVLAVGQLAGADDAQVASRIADQLNSQWAPNAPAFTPESVASQRGPDKLGGFGGVRAGNLIAIALAKETLANTPNPTPQQISQALIDAQAAVMAARQGSGQKGWGSITQNLLGGQKLGPLMKAAVSAAQTEEQLTAEKSAKGAGLSSGKVTGKTDQASSKTFDTSALQSAGVVVSGPGVGGGLGRGPDKDVSGKDAPGKDPGGAGGHGGGPGGGNGGGGGGGKSK